MKGLSALFFGTLVSIPVVGQITPEGAVDQLAVGNAQMVLAMIAVVEFLAITVMFSIWRKDVATDRQGDKDNAEALSKLLTVSSVAVSDNAQASHRLSKSMDEVEKTLGSFSVAIDRNSEVVKKCEVK